MSSRQTDVQKFEHIKQVLLADPESNDIDRLLRGETITNLRKLQVFVRKPGLELGALTFVDEGGNNSTLSEEHIGELIAIRSYLNYLQNWYGPPAVVGTVNISHTTREDFLFFIDQHADQDLENDPVRPDDDLMAQQLGASMEANNARSRSNSRGFPKDLPAPQVQQQDVLLTTSLSNGSRRRDRRLITQCLLRMLCNSQNGTVNFVHSSIHTMWIRYLIIDIPSTRVR